MVTAMPLQPSMSQSMSLGGDFLEEILNFFDSAAEPSA